MATHEENNTTKGQVTDAGDNLQDLAPQATAAPGDQQYTADKSGLTVQDAAPEGAQPPSTQEPERLLSDEDLAFLKDPELAMNSEPPFNGIKREPAYTPPPHSAGTPLGHQLAQAAGHNAEEQAAPDNEALTSHHEKKASPEPKPIKTEAQPIVTGAIPSATDTASQSALDVSEALRGDPYAFAASFSKRTQPLQQISGNMAQQRPVASEQESSNMPGHASGSHGEHSPPIPAGTQMSKQQAVIGHSPGPDLQSGQEGGAEEEEDLEKMEYTQNDDSDESGSENEDETDEDEEHGEHDVEDMRAKPQQGIAKRSQSVQQQQQHFSDNMGLQNNDFGNYHTGRPEGPLRPGHNGNLGPAGMQHFPVQPYGTDSGNPFIPVQYRGIMDPCQHGQRTPGLAPAGPNSHGGGFQNHNPFMPLNQSMMSHMPPSPYLQQHAPAPPRPNFDSYGYPLPSPSCGQPMSLQGFHPSCQSSGYSMQGHGFTPMRSSSTTDPRIKQHVPVADPMSEDGGTDDNELLRTRVARHPSVMSDTVTGNSPHPGSSDAYDEHDCGDAGSDDEIRWLKPQSVSKPNGTSKPVAEEIPKPKPIVNAGFKQIKKGAKAAPKAIGSKEVPATKESMSTPTIKATKAPSQAPTPSAAQSSPPAQEDGTLAIDWTLPKYEATFKPGETKHDETVATISIPGLIREDILLPPDTAAQETVLLTQLFLPTHEAFSYPDPEPATALMNFHTIAVMVIEAFAHWEIGDEFGTGRGHWHDEYEAKGEEEYTRVRDAKDADPDEIFFAVIDRWRAGLESGKQPARLVRGVQEFTDVALQIIFWIVENGLVREEPGAEKKKRAPRSDKGKKRGAEKEVNELEGRKKVKTAGTTGKGKAATTKGKAATTKGKAAATPKGKGTAKKGAASMTKAKKKKVEPKLTVMKKTGKD